jgi:hypothetical protein
VATNAKELDALKRLGERNYFQFTLLKKDKQPKRVGDISLKLKSRGQEAQQVHRWTSWRTTRPVEKKDKAINEPLQFYVAKGGKQPYELVVNEVGKDQITGYLLRPRTPRRGTSCRHWRAGLKPRAG